jgi:hypothetical protein
MASYHNADATRPASRAVAVTPSDATTLQVTRGLFVGTAGDVVVDMADQGSSITFANVANGQFLPIQVTKVLAATSASDILALY